MLLAFALLVASSTTIFAANDECPWGWREAGQLCYKFVDKKTDFGEAVLTCRNLRNIDFSRRNLNEDISAMMTVQDLHSMLGHHREFLDFVWKRIWLNGIKVDGKIYSIHRVPENHNADNPVDIVRYEEDCAQEIVPPEAGFSDFSNFDSSLVREYDALVLNPGMDDWGHQPMLFSENNRDTEGHYFVCTHKRNRDRSDLSSLCPGRVTECNNNGVCVNGACRCYPGTVSIDGSCLGADPTTTTTTTTTTGTTVTTTTATTTTGTTTTAVTTTAATTTAATTTAATTTATTTTATTTTAPGGGGGGTGPGGCQAININLAVGASETITSPNYPGPYNNNDDICWTFTTAAGSVLSVVFNAFDLDYPVYHEYYSESYDYFGYCDTDYVALRDGPTITDPLILKYCKLIPSAVTTTGNALFFKFVSDTSITDTGFSATITAQ